MAQRQCRVSFTDSDGISHSVDVTAISLFEAAATALGLFRNQDWAAAAITPGVVLRIEVRVPPVVHEVPLKAVEAWMRSPTTSPKDFLAKGQHRDRS